jgi:predicted transcriptional regulator
VNSSARSLNVRISPRAHAILRHLAEQEQESVQAMADKAIEQYRRERFLREANADYAALQKDKSAWKAEFRERETWDGALYDGLVEE